MIAVVVACVVAALITTTCANHNGVKTCNGTTFIVPHATRIGGTAAHPPIAEDKGKTLIYKCLTTSLTLTYTCQGSNRWVSDAELHLLSMIGTRTACPPPTCNILTTYANIIKTQPKCNDCIQGKYYLNNICTFCPIGWSSETGDIHCFKCAAGKYGKILTQQMLCAPCNPGSYRTTSTTPISCVQCPKGYYQNLLGTDSCKMCAKGMYGDGADSELKTSTSVCKYCSIGKYSIVTGASDASSCLLCPQGTFSKQTGNTKRNDCVDCMVGLYTKEEGQHMCSIVSPGYEQKDSKTEQVMCAKGRYGYGGMTSCVSCEMGYYQGKAGQTKCEQCQSGFTNSKSQSTVCDVVIQGNADVKDDDGGSVDCVSKNATSQSRTNVSAATTTTTTTPTNEDDTSGSGSNGKEGDNKVSDDNTMIHNKSTSDSDSDSSVSSSKENASTTTVRTELDSGLMALLLIPSVLLFLVCIALLCFVHTNQQKWRRRGHEVLQTDQDDDVGMEMVDSIHDMEGVNPMPLTNETKWLDEEA